MTEEDYRHLADNYRQLREDMNRLLALATTSAQYADTEDMRRVNAVYRDALKAALDGEPSPPLVADAP